jgi:hypothetical protein
MAKPMVIENTGELPAHFREAIHRAKAEQGGETEPPKAKKQSKGEGRPFGKNRQAAMAVIDTGLEQHEKLAAEGQKSQHVGPTDVLPGEQGLPPPLDPYKVEEDKAPPPPDEELVKGNKQLAALRKKQEELLGKQEAERLREEQRKAEERQKTLLGLAEGLRDKTSETGGKAASFLSALPTPGSLWFPLALLLIFFFILIPYGGHTRLQWAWLVLTGNASFNLTTEPRQTIAPAQSGDTGQPTPASQMSASSAATGSLSASGVPMIGHPF